VIMLTIITIISILSVSFISAVPLQTEDEVMEHRSDARDSFGSFVMEFRDSSVYPILLNPFAVNKLHCGSVITFYDTTTTSDATVAVDLCLTALLLAKMIFLVSLLTEGVELERLGEGGVFGVFDNIAATLAKLDLAGSGPEGEPFGDLVEKSADTADNKNDEEESEQTNKQSSYAFVPKLQSVPVAEEQSYHGFGFDSWQSGPQAFPDLQQLYDGNYLARSFNGDAKFGKIMKETLHQLEKAVSVHKN